MYKFLRRLFCSGFAECLKNGLLKPVQLLDSAVLYRIMQARTEAVRGVQIHAGPIPAAGAVCAVLAEQVRRLAGNRRQSRISN
ncbi:hypothetical protein [Acinetobacter sp. WCHAc010034]|uniref:hypothetical protein n=1 Tax=Acinetobacter sp. WCHAc010034 TaxID=1879049 RepID=UPI0013C35ED3|nr:hypothetical protein [Acinetobacter sp. WCHAc010034]